MKRLSKTAPRGEVRLAVLLLLLFVTGLMMAVLGVASCLFLGSDARALRNSFMAASPATWHQRFAVNVGDLLTGTVRFGSRLFNTPPEVRAGIDTLRAAQVGVYRGTGMVVGKGSHSPLTAMDAKMQKRGWQRLVGVLKDNDLVAVYVPRGTVSLSRMHCCFLVAHDSELVVGSVRGNLKPILEMPEVKKALETPWLPRGLFLEPSQKPAPELPEPNTPLTKARGVGSRSA